MSEPQPGVNQPSPGSSQPSTQRSEMPYSPQQQPDQQQPDKPVPEPQVMSAPDEHPTVEMRRDERLPDHRSGDLQNNGAFGLGRTPSPGAADSVSGGQPLAGRGMPSTGGLASGQMPTQPYPVQGPNGTLSHSTVSGPPGGLLQPGYASTQFGSPGLPAPGKSRKKGLLVGIVSGFVVLALLAVFLIVPWMRNTAEHVVSSYLSALSNGNADEALSYAKDRPGDMTFLTNDHLRKSNNLAGITNITVDNSGTRRPTTVTAHYKIGADSITAVFGVTKVDDVWTINQVANNVSFASKWVNSSLTTLTIRLNDQAITSTSVYLFPGTYMVSTGNKYVTVGDMAVHVKDPSSSVPTTMTASLTDEGTTAVTQAATARWKSCLAETIPEPDGCGFAAKFPGHTLKSGTQKWSQTKAPTPIENASTSLSDANPVNAVGTFSARVHGYHEYSDDASIYGTIDWDVTRFTADLSKETVSVVFDLGTRADQGSAQPATWKSN